MAFNLPVSHELAPLYLLCVFLLAFFAATVVVAMIASRNFLWLIVCFKPVCQSTTAGGKYWNDHEITSGSLN